MSKTLYLECASGISGDMTVAALLDLGADQKKLEEALQSLAVAGYETKVSRVKKSGLDCCDFSVLLDARHENHDHDMEYLHGHGEGHHHHHDHEEEHHHHHDHEEEHHHHHDHDQNHPHVHEHRGLPEIFAIIDKSGMTDRAKATAGKIFDIIGDAEARAHGLPKDQVHFHEVGAVDSIVDICAVAVLLDDLDITEVIVPGLSEGTGTIRCQHGIIPVPVPAVVHIAEAHGLNLRPTGVQGELVTPTGAAIVAAIRTADRLPSDFRIVKSGLGAGKRNYELPGILRAMLIEKKEEEHDWIWKLESNIDDCSGEELGYVLERLMQAGARDVHYTPVYMKKNRPAYMLSVICTEDTRACLEDIIFSETTTIGIRRVKMERTLLSRREETVETCYGTCQVKVVANDHMTRCYPEYTSVARLARETGAAYREVYDEAKKTWK